MRCISRACQALCGRRADFYDERSTNSALTTSVHPTSVTAQAANLQMKTQKAGSPLEVGSSNDKSAPHPPAGGLRPPSPNISIEVSIGVLN